MRYPLEVSDRERANALFREAGWDLGRPWFDGLVHPATADPDAFGLDPADFPAASRLAARMMNVPNHPLVSPRDAEGSHDSPPQPAPPSGGTLGGLRKAREILEGVWLALILPMPGRAGDRLRRAYYRRRLRHLGEGARIDVGVQIEGAEHVSIGDHVWIDKYAVLLAGPPRVGNRKLVRRSNPYFSFGEGDLVIGPNTHVAPHTVINGHGGVQIDGNTGIAAGAKIYSLSHHHRNLADPDDGHLYRFSPLVADSDQALISAPVVIREGAAISLNCVVLPGSTVGRDTWVTVGSVVLGDLPERSIASGSPAAAVRQRS